MKVLIRLVSNVLQHSGHAGLVLVSISVLVAAMLALLLRSIFD